MSPSEARAPLAYGAANLGNLHRELSDADASAILEAAWDAGIRSYDTAPHYGMGLSERRLGAFLRDKPRNEYTVSTKAGRLIRPGGAGDGFDTDNDFHVPNTTTRVWDFTAAGIATSFDESLERLGLDRVDTLYLHDPERYSLEAALADALPAMEELRRQGRVDRIGVGSMDTDALATVVNGADLDVVMIAGRYTLLEQPAAEAVLPACRLRDTEVVAASVFNSGMLALPEPRRDARYEYGSASEELWTRLQRIVELCRRFEIALPAAALAYPAREPAVTSVVVGGSRPSHLRQNVQYATIEIPEDFWRALSDAGLIPAETGRPEGSRC